MARQSKFFKVLTSAALTIGMLIPSSVMASVGQPVITIPTLDEVECQSYCVYDKTADEIILGKLSHNRCYPASMTKIMTAQLGLDYLDTDAYLTVSQNAIDNVTSDSTLMYIYVGEEVEVSELLYGMMLPSGNDAANVVAEGVIDALFANYPAGGDVGPDGVNAGYFEDLFGMSAEDILAGYKLSAFAELMNVRATNLGCTGTHFTNANGLHSDEHYTTSSDLTLIMARAVENPDFCTVISSPTHIFQATNMHTEDGWSTVRNTNGLITDPWMCATTAEGEDTHISAFIGGKTGTTSAAGTGMVVYTVNENGHELLIAVNGIPSDYYSYKEKFVASVTAYGNLTCWENDPVSVVPGTLGDYQRFNTTDAELPQYDPLIVPGDTLDQAYLPEGFTEFYGGDGTDPSDGTGDDTGDPDGTSTEESSGTGEVSTDIEVIDKPASEDPGAFDSYSRKILGTDLATFVKNNALLCGIVVLLIVLILVCIIVLTIRSILNGRRRKRRKARPFKGNYDDILGQ